MENQNEVKNEDIKIDDLVSIEANGTFLKGIVTAIESDHFKINSYTNGDVTVPISFKDNAIKMYPGQKYDFRELNLIEKEENGKSISVRDKIDKYLAKTSVGKFENLDKSEQLALMSGRLTNKIYKGGGIKTGENGEKKLVEWEGKFKLFNGQDNRLKLKTEFVQKELNLKVYGKEVSPKEKEALIDKKQSLILERETKEGAKFKIIAYHDKDLNSIVTLPYSKKIEERILNARKREQKEGKKLEPKAKIQKATPKNKSRKKL